MRSLTGTLFRGVILAALFVMVGAGTILYLSVRAQMIRQFDQSLTDKARMLALSVEQKHYGLEVDLEEMRAGDMEEADKPEYLSIGSPDGRTIYRSKVLDNLPATDKQAPLSEESCQWHRMPDGRKLRSVIFSFTPENDDEREEPVSQSGNPGIVIDTASVPGARVVVRLFRDASDLSLFMEAFLLMLIATGLGSIGILSLTIWWAIKRGSDPVNELASRIEAVGKDDLTVRFDEGTVLVELVPIVHKLNLFMDRLERSFNRERGFTSDAAHELRTPLAGLKSTIEVALARKRESGEYRETLERAHDIVGQLESLVKGLLTLARLEAGQEQAVWSQVRLQSCVAQVWEAYGPEADKKGIEVLLELRNGIVTTVDRNMLTLILDELFRNAVNYVDSGGFIKVDLFRQGEETNLRVSNTGSKVSSQDAERVFDRFWRGTQSRNDTGKRFGLGLPIVGKIAETIGVKLRVESKMNGEFVVTLTMPGEQRGGNLQTR